MSDTKADWNRAFLVTVEPLCAVADVCGCWGWDGGNGTWESGGLRGCPEGEDARLGLALHIHCHNANLVLRIPVQAAQHHILAAAGEADLWFPVRPVLLRKECGGDKTLKAGRLSECGHYLQAQREGSHFRDFHDDPVLMIGLLADGMYSSLNNFPDSTSPLKGLLTPPKFVTPF